MVDVVLADPACVGASPPRRADYAAEWADSVMAGRLAALYRRLLAAPQSVPPVHASQVVSTR